MSMEDCGAEGMKKPANQFKVTGCSELLNMLLKEKWCEGQSHARYNNKMK